MGRLLSHTFQCSVLAAGGSTNGTELPQPRFQSVLAGQKLHLDPHRPKRDVSQPVHGHFDQVLAGTHRGGNAQAVAPLGQPIQTRAACSGSGRGTRGSRRPGSRRPPACAGTRRDCRCRRTPPPLARESPSSGISSPPAETSVRGAWIASARSAAGAWTRTVSQSSARLAGSSRSARESTTTSARRSPSTGSRNRPRGKTWPKPNGSSASKSTISRSRAMPAVLEAVVQHDQLAAELRDGLLRGGQAVGILHVRHVGKQPPHLQRLVVRLARGRPIAAADHRHPHAALLEPAGDPLDQGGLAGAAEGEVADAHDRHAERDARPPRRGRTAGSASGRPPRSTSRRSATRRAAGWPRRRAAGRSQDHETPRD